MHHEFTTGTATARPRNGVLTLRGFGIRVVVERGYLTIEDGRGKEKRTARFPRVTRDLKRLTIIGHTGMISFEALRWLHDRGCGFMQIDADGTMLAASGPVGSDDARLRRAQAIAGVTDTGIALARDILTRKLDGQASVLSRIPGSDDAAASIRLSRDAMESASTIPELRNLEGQAAASYWDAWSDISIGFARKIADHVPDHWKHFGVRTSPITGSPRLASNPINAILNYLYAMLEAESRLALLAVGLDPGIGVIHADQRNRDSFACDVMEAVRPDVDSFVLDFIESRYFGNDDFFETRQGACRLMPTITQPLAESSPMWAQAVAPVVEDIARTLHRDNGLTGPRSTPLTQANRSAGRERSRDKTTRKDAPRVRPTYEKSSPSKGSKTHRKPRHHESDRMRQAVLQSACPECGSILVDSTRKYCDECLDAAWRDQRINSFGPSGPAALAELRASGIDPAHGGDAGKARGKRNASHQAAIAEWEASPDKARFEDGDTFDPDVFTNTILPALQDVTLQAMANATGLTKGYCSFVRRGLKVPHPRHWDAFASIISRKAGT